ncbi:hypothetical protein J1N35_007880 [Gossypium stocksii]|uniref:Aminotransferase-like plant mobile domain-containing protein n=1 Tax=Gossypium stocksii TaxID=47602 RepID=A0A9D3W7Q7_9ROSI|nr:hypothetical protein J1N35_007880 [Gossypium stocksii]
MPYLEQVGFGPAALIWTLDLRYDLISALVECWHPETRTFHFLCGECTVTLEDIVLQLGLPIDGSPVTSVSAIAEPATFCYNLLGASPGDDESNFLVLAVLYHELCRMTKLAAIDIGGCLILLQSWALYRMPFLASVGKVHLINKRGKHGMHWGVVHQRYFAVWDNQMARRPQMDMFFDLQPSLEYIQWYSSMGKPYLLGGQLTVVPPHM